MKDRIKNNNSVFSVDKYKFLAENSPDVLLQTTKIGNITYMSKNVESEYGYKLNEVIGKHFRNFVPSSEMPRYLLKMREMISGKTITGFRTFVKHKNGNLIPIELSGKFVKYQNKSYFNAIMRNISEKIQTEKALKESELQRKFILDTIPDLLFIINKQGFFVGYHGNPNSLYQPPEIFLNKKIEMVLPSELSKNTMKFVEKALKTNKLQIFEYSLKIKNKFKWFEARMLAISKNKVISIIRDITSLKEHQEELIKNKEYLQLIINSATEIIFTLNLKKKIIIWNDSAKKLTGYNKKDIINKNLKKTKIIDNIIKFESYISKIIKDRKNDQFEIILNTKFNTKRLWLASPSFIYNKLNEISEILFICKDITFEKEIHSEIIFGRSYIFFDPKNDIPFDIFCKTLINKSNGLIITREITDKINEICSKKNIDIIQLSSKQQKYFSVNDLNSLYNLIEKKINQNSIIFLERLDYLINMNSYQEVLLFLYKLNDLIKKRKALLLLRINPDSISKQNLSILKEEFFEYPFTQINEITIDKDLYEIIDFINSRNENNIYVTYKDIGIKFSISKITVTRKVEELKKLNLIQTYKSGRTKIIELTNEGKKIIHKDNIK